jgi:RNA polymerase sigma-70 factor, ECF subfamily
LEGCVAKPVFEHVTGTASEVASNSVREATLRAYLDRCAAGDQNALGALYDESGRLVYSLVLRVLGGVEDAEEVTMDVFAHVWRSAGSYDHSRGSVSAWLATLARNRAIDRLRSHRIRLQREAPFPETVDFPCRGISPEGHTEENQKRCRVRAALETLTPEQREAVELAFYSGLTHSELAQRLQEPLGTVKSRIRMGMVKLRLQLEPLFG